MENPVKGLRDQVDGHVSEGRQSHGPGKHSRLESSPYNQLLEPGTLTLHGNRCDSVRTSEVRSLSGILWVSPKCKHEPPSKTRQRETCHRRGGHVATEQRLSGAASRSWRKQGTVSPRASRGCTALVTPCFTTSGLQDCERLNFTCFKLPSFWSFPTAAIGKSYREKLRIGPRAPVSK